MNVENIKLMIKTLERVIAENLKFRLDSYLDRDVDASNECYTIACACGWHGLFHRIPDEDQNRLFWEQYFDLGPTKVGCIFGFFKNPCEALYGKPRFMVTPQDVIVKLQEIIDEKV